MPEPVLPLTGAVVDPCADRRTDSDWVDTQWAGPAARVAVFAGDRVAVRDGGVAWLPTGQVPQARQGNWALLGVDPDGAALLAADLGETAASPVADADFRTVRELGLAAAGVPEFGAVVTALALLNWHRRHPRCPLCGQPTELTHAGWQRRCPADGSDHFPRVDPAVIMLVVDDDERALLGRQERWPPKWFSTLAGFVEPGETLENAVRREVHEEVGVTVDTVTYLASQPWPFPSSLMLGFHARAAGGELRPDGREIAEARWFTRQALVEACASGGVRLPPPLSISRWLVEQWYGEPLPGDWSR